jgi:hypothetical protein
MESALSSPLIMENHFERTSTVRKANPPDQPFQLRWLSVKTERGHAGAGSASC